MLTANFDIKSDKLKIEFDFSIPHSVENFDELGFLLQNINECASTDFLYEHGELKGFTVARNDWVELIDRILPVEEARLQQSIIDDLLRLNLNKQGPGLEINFHQNPFDTPARYWNFILNQGNFIDYFFNRINWYMGPKNGIVTPFPLHVDIESASTCNMNCPMCYRDIMKESGQMEFDVFKKAVDECAENNVFSIRLSWRGETLTHPMIKEMISYATSRIKNVSFLTNAFYLDENMVDCFIENRVSYIAVSFDGIGKIYESIRHPAKFEENYKRLAMLLKKKRQSREKHTASKALHHLAGHKRRSRWLLSNYEKGVRLYRV